MFTCEEKEVQTNEGKVRSFSVVLFGMMGMDEIEFCFASKCCLQPYLL